MCGVIDREAKDTACRIADNGVVLICECSGMGLIDMLITFSQCNFSMEFPVYSYTCISKMLSLLSVSGCFKIMHCGILTKIPYCVLLKGKNYLYG